MLNTSNDSPSSSDSDADPITGVQRECFGNSKIAHVLASKVHASRKQKAHRARHKGNKSIEKIEKLPTYKYVGVIRLSYNPFFLLQENYPIYLLLCEKLSYLDVQNGTSV